MCWKLRNIWGCHQGMHLRSPRTPAAFTATWASNVILSSIHHPSLIWDCESEKKTVLTAKNLRPLLPSSPVFALLPWKEKSHHGSRSLFPLKSRTMLEWFPDSQECIVCQNQGRSVSQYDQMWSCCEVLNSSFSIPNRVCGRCAFYDVVYWMWTKHLFHLRSNRSVIIQMYIFETVVVCLNFLSLQRNEWNTVQNNRLTRLTTPPCASDLLPIILKNTMIIMLIQQSYMPSVKAAQWGTCSVISSICTCGKLDRSNSRYWVQCVRCSQRVLKTTLSSDELLGCLMRIIVVTFEA